MIRTGREYRESSRDGHELYINGEKVEHVNTYPMASPLDTGAIASRGEKQ